MLRNLSPGKQCIKLLCELTLAYYCYFSFNYDTIIFIAICLVNLATNYKFIILLKLFQFATGTNYEPGRISYFQMVAKWSGPFLDQVMEKVCTMVQGLS